jgi:hypothetical protein
MGFLARLATIHFDAEVVGHKRLRTVPTVQKRTGLLKFEQFNCYSVLSKLYGERSYCFPRLRAALPSPKPSKHLQVRYISEPYITQSRTVFLSCMLLLRLHVVHYYVDCCALCIMDYKSHIDPML